MSIVSLLQPIGLGAWWLLQLSRAFNSAGNVSVRFICLFVITSNPVELRILGKFKIYLPSGLLGTIWKVLRETILSGFGGEVNSFDQRLQTHMSGTHEVTWGQSVAQQPGSTPPHLESIWQHNGSQTSATAGSGSWGHAVTETGANQHANVNGLTTFS